MREQLIDAIRKKDTQKAMSLIEQMTPEELYYIDDYIFSSGYTALMYVAESGHEEIYEMLLEKMGSEAINTVNNNGFTALMIAAHSGHEKICEMLLEKMSSEAINVREPQWGETALMLAIRSGHEKICEMLLKKMSSEAINTVNNSGFTALECAIESSNEKICEMLLEKMSLDTINVGNLDNPLMLAVGFDDEKICEILLEKMSSVTINVRDEEGGDTALMYAVRSGNEKICEMLLEKMSLDAINVDNLDGNTALMYASVEGKMDIALKLIGFGAKIDADSVREIQKTLAKNLPNMSIEKLKTLHSYKDMKELKELYTNENYLKPYENYLKTILGNQILGDVFKDFYHNHYEQSVPLTVLLGVLKKYQKTTSNEQEILKIQHWPLVDILQKLVECNGIIDDLQNNQGDQDSIKCLNDISQMYQGIEELMVKHPELEKLGIKCLNLYFERSEPVEQVIIGEINHDSDLM